VVGLERLGGGIPGRCEGDVEAELLELGDEAAGLAFWVAAALEVVVAEVMEALAGRELVPDEIAQAVRYGDSGLVRAAPLGDLAVLCAEVATPCPGRGRAASIRARRSQLLPGVIPTRRRLPADS
jgi:hypothetical protein